MRRGKHVISFIALVSLLFPAVAWASYPLIQYPHVPAIEKMRPNGDYSIYVMKEGKWQEAGKLVFDEFYRERQIDLSSYLTGDKKARIRLVQHGGEAAHIDSVFLGNEGPAEVKSVEDGIKKLSKKDFDVIDVFDRSIEVTFNKDAKDKTLKLTARVEDVNRGLPFQFPVANTYRKIDASADFYSYNLNTTEGNLTIDGRLDEVTDKSPFFKEYSLAGTGHPSGFTYGWVRNDDKNLYVSIDFTPDDTMDGYKDYSKVYIETVDGVKEFKVSVAETKWGKAGFTYTDKVGYQHKVYEFKIPLKEIMDVQKGHSEKILLAFSAYGTAGVCCFRNGSCNTDILNCENQGAVYLPDPTSCNPNPCPQPSAVPTMTQWGALIFVVFGGLLAVFYMRRQTKKNN